MSIRDKGRAATGALQGKPEEGLRAWFQRMIKRPKKGPKPGTVAVQTSAPTAQADSAGMRSKLSL